MPVPATDLVSSDCLLGGFTYKAPNIPLWVVHSEEWDNVEDRFDLVSTKQLDYFIEEFSSCFIAPVLQTGQSAACVPIEPTNLHGGGEEGKLW